MRLTLSDKMKLRTTSVYKAPRDISVLKVLYGDLSLSSVLCTALDKEGYLWHASDRPMQAISSVAVDGEPKTAGFRTYTSYQDETGSAIACVLFDNPQYEKRVSVSGKGCMKLDNGELIENPADILKDVFLNIQGYDESIVGGEISRLYSDCLKQDIRLAFVLDHETLKAFMTELGLNIHAWWLLSDARPVVRLKWV
jgi:hypothetical protein